MPKFTSYYISSPTGDLVAMVHYYMMVRAPDSKGAKCTAAFFLLQIFTDVADVAEWYFRSFSWLHVYCEDNCCYFIVYLKLLRFMCLGKPSLWKHNIFGG